MSHQDDKVTTSDKKGLVKPHGQFLVYTAEDGQVKIDVRLENETVWLTQRLMAELFAISVPTINEHLKNVFTSGELDEDSVIRNFRITAADGKQYATNFYNLDAIISVGYRVKSAVATRFRIWATQQLREFIVVFPFLSLWEKPEVKGRCVASNMAEILEA